ncbi:MAG: hypothetical protein IR158_05990 [Cellulomonas sp.]|uniref:hypothetical protein n=1 Tax=Cellulomonas sp. TaxID=40001 RepID=UPI0019DC1E13|nr:hypothetical protein [Cellulomonas sp.]MBF0687306.1 hypothetical protein [Cellulomonas sp.]
MTEVVREPVLGVGLGEGRFVDTVTPTDTVTCPECGTRSTLDLLRRDASAFCPQCDFPLFWADRGAARAAASDVDQGPVRRSPGVEGEVAGVVVACLVCGEHNAHARGPCVRCGADLTPRPAPVLPPPPAPEPEPQVLEVLVPVPCTHPRTWVVALVSALLGAGVAFVVAMLVLS